MTLAVLNSTACRSSYGRLSYIFNQSAHNNAKTNHRVLACSGTNIRMLHDPNGQLTTLQSGAYLEKQFRQSLRRAYNPKRKYQAQSIIISFSNQEFDTNNLNQQTIQALQLVQGYVHQYFNDAQSVACVQCDGDGGKLHVHLLINTVKPNGKTVPTNRFTVYRMRKDWNNYLEQHFQAITGRQWQNSFKKQVTREDIQKLTSHSSWEEQLKQTINRIKQEVHNVADFLNHLSKEGISVKERGKKKRWTYTQIISDKNGKPRLKRVRAFYQRKDKAGHVLSTRGLGKSYTREGLENYWQQQKEKERVLTPTPGHHRKVVDQNDRSNVQFKQSEEELIKIRTIAKEAQAAANNRQRRNQLNLQRLQAAEAGERKQRDKSQIESFAQRQCSATKDDLSQLASSEDVQKLRSDISESNKNVQNELTAKMSNQTSKLIDIVKGTRDIAYNDGLQADITSTRQQVDALQKRQDMSNVHMNEVTRQNEAMNADLKQIGPAIDKVVKAQNNNSNILNRALTYGFHVHTDAVTIAVVAEFKKITGLTIEEFLRNEIIKGMTSNINEANLAKLDAVEAAQIAEEALEHVGKLIQDFFNLMSILVLELGIIIGITIILPSWWKLGGLVIATVGALLVNKYLKAKGDNYAA